MRKSASVRVAITFSVAFVTVACSGDRSPRTPTSPTPVDLFSGPYSLTVTAGAECTGLPEVLRTRSYLASIEPRGADSYVVTLSGASFLADEQIGERAFRLHCSSSYGLDCNQFTASHDNDRLRLRLAPNSERFDDEFAGSGGSIVELIPPDNSRLGISGTGLGRLDATTIQASIDGQMWSCPAKYRSPDECSGCGGATIAMTFTRR
jgi:hypothetical protein